MRRVRGRVAEKVQIESVLLRYCHVVRRKGHQSFPRLFVGDGRINSNCSKDTDVPTQTVSHWVTSLRPKINLCKALDNGNEPLTDAAPRVYQGHAAVQYTQYAKRKHITDQTHNNF